MSTRTGARSPASCIEARVQEDRAYLAIGIGVNMEPVTDDERPNAVAIRELSPRDFRGLDEATIAFVEHLDSNWPGPWTATG